MKQLKKLTTAEFESVKSELVDPWVVLTDDGAVHYKESDEEVAPSIEVVDLGLPSGTMWMKYNVGATSETEYGLLFQWGDTVGYTDASHSTWSTAPFNGGNLSYNASAFAAASGTACPNGVLAAQYDAASVATSGVAHMPTQEQLEELAANTTLAFTTVNGVSGIKLTSKKEGYTDKYIFIPASGIANNGSVYGRGSYGSVWSSSLLAGSPRYAWNLSFDSSSVGVYSGGDRCFGYSVRGVVSK